MCKATRAHAPGYVLSAPIRGLRKGLREADSRRIGWDAYAEYFWQQRIVRSVYAYVGLQTLDAVPNAKGENLLGSVLIALMRLPADRRASCTPRD